MSYGRSNRNSIDWDEVGVYIVFAIIVVVWWILVGLFHAYDPFRSYLYWWNVNPIAMITLNMLVIGGGIAAIKGMSIDSSSATFNFFDWFCTGIGVIGLLWGCWNMATYNARVMVALRSQTYYQPADSPVPITDMRVSSYAEAQANFNTQNPDARFQIGNMNYIRDQWVAEYGPKGFLNSFNFPTQGFYEYNPVVSEKPVYVSNPMTFAESGIADNNLHVLIAKRDPFAYYEKALWAPDSENPGHYMAVVSLTKRIGSDAVPYVSNIVLIHEDGRQEWLTANEASADKRLVGLQIIPEWLESMRIKAYGYTHGVWDALFIHTDQVQVQTSSTDEENKPPFHMRSGDIMYWVTPMSPYNTPSFIGLAWQQSNDINGPIHVWKVPKAYSGVDAMAANIKTAKGHPSDVDWLINNGGTVSGKIEILEMLPVGHNKLLYFVGYAALGSNPQKTRMFVVIRALDNVVMQDLFSIKDVNTWLEGTGELSVLTPTTSQPAVTSASQLDLSGYSIQQLWSLLQQVINEIQKRGTTGGTMIASSNAVSYHNDTDLYNLAGRIIWQIIFK